MIGRRRSTPVAEQLNLPELVDVLRHRWKLILAVAAFVTLGAAVYAELLPAEYEAEAVTAFSPRPDVDPDTVLLLLPKYVAYVTAPSTVTEAAETLDEDPAELQSAVAATAGEDTGNLTITVRLPTPDRAADAANRLARMAVSFSASDELIRGEVVASALPPSSPAWPPRRLMEAAALFVGLILGVALAALVERGNPRVRTWRDISQLTGYPLLGRFPTSRALRSPSAAGGFADPIVGASARTLRTSLETKLWERTMDVVAVTSPSRGDGKSTISVLLAEALSRLGIRVLLVDADLRRPALMNLVRRAPRSIASVGLASVLHGRASLQDAVRHGWREGLWLLPTQEDPEAGDLLAKRFAEVMDEAKQHFDVIVVDTPPLIGTDDSRTIARSASGVLLVVKSGSPAATVHEAVMALESLKASVLGVVGNRIREGRAAYYAYK